MPQREHLFFLEGDPLRGSGALRALDIGCTSCGRASARNTPCTSTSASLETKWVEKKCSNELHLLTWPPLPWGPALYQIPDSKQCHHQTQSEEKKHFHFHQYL